MFTVERANEIRQAAKGCVPFTDHNGTPVTPVEGQCYCAYYIVEAEDDSWSEVCDGSLVRYAGEATYYSPGGGVHREHQVIRDNCDDEDKDPYAAGMSEFEEFFVLQA